MERARWTAASTHEILHVEIILVGDSDGLLLIGGALFLGTRHIEGR